MRGQRWLMFMLLAFTVLTSCSSGSTTYDNPPPPASDPAWARIAPLVSADCGPCHNGTKEPAFTSGAVFKASAAKAKLTGGLMPPPPKVISAADKAALLTYLGG